jgi:hypothetical protein
MLFWTLVVRAFLYDCYVGSRRLILAILAGVDLLLLIIVLVDQEYRLLASGFYSRQHLWNFIANALTVTITKLCVLVARYSKKDSFRSNRHSGEALEGEGLSISASSVYRQNAGLSAYP